MIVLGWAGTRAGWNTEASQYLGAHEDSEKSYEYGRARSHWFFMGLLAMVM